MSINDYFSTGYYLTDNILPSIGILSNFCYQVDLSSILESNPKFKSRISSSENISVYDPSTDTILPKQCLLDLTNNYLLLYWKANVTTGRGKIFYIVAHLDNPDPDSSTLWYDAGYSRRWGMHELSGTTVHEDVTDFNGFIAGKNNQISLGNNGKFGKCAYGITTTGYDGIDYIGLTNNNMFRTDVDETFEFIAYIEHEQPKYFIADSYDRQKIAYHYYGRIFFTANAISDPVFSAENAFMLKKWFHVVITKTSSGIVNFYVDGVLSGNADQNAGELSSGINHSAIMNWFEGHYCLNGYMSDVGRIDGIKSTEWIDYRYRQFLQNGFHTITNGGYVVANLNFGTYSYVEKTVKGVYATGNLTDFVYSIDMSPILASSPEFKNKITDSGNISVYDTGTQSILPKKCILSLANNYLLVSFITNVTALESRTFLIIAHTVSSDADSSTLYSGYSRHWGLHEVSGTTAVEDVSALNGTATGNASLGNTNGKLGRCAYNTGTAVAVVDITGGDLFPTGAITVEFLASFSYNAGVLFLSNGNGHQRIGHTGWAGTMFLSWDGSTIITSADSAMPNNTWFHVAITRTAAGITNIYINGILSGGANQNGGIPLAGVGLGGITANIEGASGCISGYMSDIRILNSVKSTSYITFSYNMFMTADFWTTGSVITVTNKQYETIDGSSFVNIDRHINAGYNVSFRDDSGNLVNAKRILLNTTGTVSFCGVGYNTGMSMRLLAGRIHKIGGIGTVFSSDTTPNLGICITL